jgi:hypothetical protein
VCLEISGDALRVKRSPLLRDVRATALHGRRTASHASARAVAGALQSGTVDAGEELLPLAFGEPEDSGERYGKIPGGYAKLVLEV